MSRLCNPQWKPFCTPHLRPHKGAARVAAVAAVHAGRGTLLEASAACCGSLTCAHQGAAPVAVAAVAAKVQATALAVVAGMAGGEAACNGTASEQQAWSHQARDWVKFVIAHAAL